MAVLTWDNSFSWDVATRTWDGLDSSDPGGGGVALVNTTTELVTFDGVSLNQYCWNIATGTGRYNTPAHRGEDITLPGRSGTVFVPNKPTEVGTYNLLMWVQGTDDAGLTAGTINARRQLFESNIATLQRLFTRRSKLSYITVVQPDASLREAYVQVAEAIEPEIQGQRQHATFTVALQIPDVYWQDTSDTVQAGSAGSSLPKTLTLSSFAGMEGPIEDSVLTVTGPISNPRITDSETGIYVQYNGTVSNGSTWVVDCKNFTSRVNGGDVLAATTHVGHPRFLVISPWNGIQATPQVVLSGSAGGGTTNISVTARRKWFSA
jgi:hypothetical protein